MATRVSSTTRRRPTARRLGGALEGERAGVAPRLDEGDRLYLRIDGAKEWFARNSPRGASAALLHDLVVMLPVL